MRCALYTYTQEGKASGLISESPEGIAHSSLIKMRGLLRRDSCCDSILKCGAKSVLRSFAFSIAAEAECVMLNFIRSYYMEIIACSAPVSFIMLVAIFPKLMEL
jgi:hypothetical protein